jgi:RimJ/RimL family protein N-acetyltransferase
MDACTLRLYEPADAEDLYAAIHESMAEVSRWMAWCHPGYTLADARDWIAAQAALTANGLAYQFAVRSHGRYAGGCGINQINAVNRFANVGYWIRTSATGQGLAPAAVRLVTSFAFAQTDLLRLEIVCAVDNVRSQRVAEKVGASREGILRRRLVLPHGPSDAVMFSVVRGDELPRRDQGTGLA